MDKATFNKKDMAMEASFNTKNATEHLTVVFWSDSVDQIDYHWKASRDYIIAAANAMGFTLTPKDGE